MFFITKSINYIRHICLFITVILPYTIYAGNEIGNTAAGPGYFEEVEYIEEINEAPITNIETRPTLAQKRRSKLIRPTTEATKKTCSPCQVRKSRTRKLKAKQNVVHEKKPMETKNRVRPSEKRKLKQQLACNNREQLQKERSEKRRTKKATRLKARQERYANNIKESRDHINQQLAKRDGYRKQLKAKRETAELLVQRKIESILEEKLARIALLHNHKLEIKNQSQKQAEILKFIQEQKTEEARLQHRERENYKLLLAKERQQRRLDRIKFNKQIECEKIALRNKEVEQRAHERNEYKKKLELRLLAQREDRAKKRAMAKQKQEHYAHLQISKKQRSAELLEHNKLLLKEARMLNACADQSYSQELHPISYAD